MPGVISVLLGLMILASALYPVFAGDSLYGKVTEVKTADVVILDYGTGHYVVHIIGIDVPTKTGRSQARPSSSWRSSS